MCGILCQICYTEKDTQIYPIVIKRLLRRGPDINFKQNITITKDIKLMVMQTVLWMQGPFIPISLTQNDYGLLLYNGDIFDDTWDRGRSDRDIVMDKLTQNNTLCTESNTIEVFKSLKGPFSIIFLDKINNEIYFTRDRIGRNSLLFHRDDNNIIISSVLDRNYKCVEVPATNIFKLNILTQKVTSYMWDSVVTEEFSVTEWLIKTEKEQELSNYDISFNFIPLLGVDQGDDVINYMEHVAEKYHMNRHMVFYQLLKHPVILNTVNTLIELLRKSVKMRVQRQPNKCKNCLILQNHMCDHCTVGILFSGGLDSTILAALASNYIGTQHSIHLINVGFEKEDQEAHEVPDRLTSRLTYEELQHYSPFRKWVYLDIDVEEEEMEKCRNTMIVDLIHPRKTVLDVSLGTVLWFAARSSKDVAPFTSPCRILLVGTGADELFGGYTRHRNAFKRHGWTGLSKELQLDWQRISYRNLGRDNRVMCDSSRTPRLPYLDEDVTNFVLGLKPWLRCFPCDKLGPGVGDKLLLRLVAFKLELKNVSTFPKRAMQFGTRIANKKEKGNDIHYLFK